VEKPKKNRWGKDKIEYSSDFRGADLSGESFSNNELPQRDFRRAILRGAEFIECDLTGANFADADLSGANFRHANLQDVDFSNADLTKANLYRANLAGAAFIASNLFGGVDCLYRSGNNLPLRFLQSAGFPKAVLTYLPELVQAGASIQFHSCFVSYSHLDEAFARRLWGSLRNERIRVWYAPEEMHGGKMLFEQIDRAIQLHDKLLVVLSKSSLASNWVQTEIRRARKEEQKKRERKLFPIRLCDMRTLKAWECFDADTGRDIAEEIRAYFIPDFSEWTEPGMFEPEFKKLCRDLRQEGVAMRNEGSK